MGESLERLVRRTPGLRWDGFMTGGQGVLEAIAVRATELVLMDMHIPGTDTCKLVRDIAERFPHTRVLMLSGHMRRDYILTCIDSGAVGYVGKHREPQYITDAIRKVASGEFFLCPDAAAAAGLS
jgi:two-component system response regulator DesR